MDSRKTTSSKHQSAPTDQLVAVESSSSATTTAGVVKSVSSAGDVDSSSCSESTIEMADAIKTIASVAAVDHLESLELEAGDYSGKESDSSSRDVSQSSSLVSELNKVDISAQLSEDVSTTLVRQTSTQTETKSCNNSVDSEPYLGVIVPTVQTQEMTSTTSRSLSRIRWWLWLFIIVMVVLVAIITWRLSMYQWVVIDGQQFKTQTEEQIVQQLINRKKDQNIKFQMANRPVVELKMGNIGIGIDSEKLANLVRERRQLNIGNLFSKADIEPPMIIDYPVLQSALDDCFKEGMIKPVDAKLTYDRAKNTFVTTPSTAGYRIDARRVIADPRLLTDDNPILTVSYQVAEPTITERDLKSTETYLNQRLKLRLNLNHEGKLLYFVDPWDIADWVELRPNPTAKKPAVDFNRQKIEAFIEKKVSPEIARGVINQKVLVDNQNRVLQVLQPGRRGLGAVNPGNSADQIRQALLNNQNLEHNLDIKEINFSEERVPIDGLRWIEVNLTRQTATLYSGDKALQTFTISSGVNPWPTPTGTYRVWFKNPLQRMRGGSREAGDYYDLPNVRWNTYFNRDIGFHTAYWHNNFGRPMSHGCINMREADAKVVFDFAPIGTTVVVKY